MREGSFSARDRLLFAACRQNPSEPDRQKMMRLASEAPIDWQELLNISCQHGLAPLAFHNLCLIPEIASVLPAAGVTPPRLRAPGQSCSRSASR